MELKPTKYILHGGTSPEKSDKDNSPFYIEILKDAPEGARVLLVPFAREADRAIPSLERVRKEFENAKWQKSVSVDVATEENLLEQVRASDVIYFHGGASALLLPALKKYTELKKRFEGKIVAGESAGATVLCAFFYSARVDTVFEGLGILPLKIIPHYKKELEGKLDGVGKDLEALLLPEYEFKVFCM